MTKSTITRERLEELASGQSGFNLRIATLEESQELARMALATLASDPVAEVYQPQNAGICAPLGPSIRMLCPLEPGEKLYRYAQPAPVVPVVPVVPDEIKHRIGGLDWGWEGEFNRGWNACRAAMLQELKKSAGTEAICRSDENVQVLHTKSPAQSDCCPAQNHVSPEQNGDTPAQSQGWIQVSERMPEAEGHYLVWTNASRIDGYCDHLAIATYQGGGWSNEFNWLVTHWMPLPAGPKEVK
ncbi:TPA: DUF551 domain-containing protein [Klebsiella pneumoniae]|nr:DUF551 domain-containing protein [Klebsiella pneumoniae]